MNLSDEDKRGGWDSSLENTSARHGLGAVGALLSNGGLVEIQKVKGQDCLFIIYSPSSLYKCFTHKTITMNMY